MARILIAEDEPDIRNLIEFTLKFGGHEVFAFSNGGDAVEQTPVLMPDLILLDVRMPRLTGYEACSALKEDEKTKNIPVVFLSAKGQESEVNEGLALGAVAYILKPFAPDHLISQINKIMKEQATGAAEKPKVGGEVAGPPKEAAKPQEPAAAAEADKPKEAGSPPEKPPVPADKPKEVGFPPVRPAAEPDKPKEVGAPPVRPALAGTPAPFEKSEAATSPAPEKKPDGDSPASQPGPPATKPVEPDKKPGENSSTTKPPGADPARSA